MFSAVGMCEQAVLAFTKVRISRNLSPILRLCTNYKKQFPEVQSPLTTCIPSRGGRESVGKPFKPTLKEVRRGVTVICNRCQSFPIPHPINSQDLIVNSLF